MNSSTYGTFRDCLNAPIHRWFTYPAGFSFKLVEAKARQYGLGSGDVALDPFAGAGTTSLAAKQVGINSVGVEAHPFVCWVAETKLGYDKYDLDLLSKEMSLILECAQDSLVEGGFEQAGWPALVHKCFDTPNLDRLYALRTAVLECVSERHNFFKLALTAALRDTTTAGAGWPYIAPNKHAARKTRRNAFHEFKKRCALMQSDVAQAAADRIGQSEHTLINGDARKLLDYTSSVDMILTSPPYLNNYDYADRTRIETYFWGLYNSWAEITTNVRDKLMMSATTQVRRSTMNTTSTMPLIKAIDHKIHDTLTGTVNQLTKLRTERAGKKSYDLMIAGYFEDITQIVTQAAHILQPGQPFILVVGDSAPYGIHVATDTIIGELATKAGFCDYHIEVIRTRGDKWSKNTQRHKVPLRESILTITR